MNREELIKTINELFEDFDMEIDHFVYKCEKCGEEWI